MSHGNMFIIISLKRIWLSFIGCTISQIRFRNNLIILFLYITIYFYQFNIKCISAQNINNFDINNVPYDAPNIITCWK